MRTLTVLVVLLSVFLFSLQSCKSKSVTKGAPLTGSVLLASEAGLLLKNLSTGKTDTLAQSPQGCFSPDGQFIAFFDAKETAIRVVRASDRQEVKKITVQTFGTNFSLNEADGKTVLYWEDNGGEKGTLLYRALVESSSEPTVIRTYSFNDSPMIVTVPSATHGDGKQGLAIGFDNNNGSPIKSLYEMDFSPVALRKVTLDLAIVSYSNIEVSKDNKYALVIAGRKEGTQDVVVWPWSKSTESKTVSLPAPIAKADSLVDSAAYNSKNWQIAAASFSSANSNFLCLTNAYYKPLGPYSKMIAATRAVILNRETNESFVVANMGILDYFPGE